MQPTVESQTRLRRLVWLLGGLLALTVALGGVHLARMADEVQASQSALESAKRDVADARRAAEAAEKVTREAGAEAQAASAQREEIAAKLRAAETARAEAEARLKAATEKLNAAPHE
jgi:chromosome segregation ATPase